MIKNIYAIYDFYRSIVYLLGQISVEEISFHLECLKGLEISNSKISSIFVNDWIDVVIDVSTLIKIVGLLYQVSFLHYCSNTELFYLLILVLQLFESLEHTASGCGV